MNGCAEWLTTIATLGALWVSAMSWRQEHKRLKEEKAEAALLARAEQANKIDAWIEAVDLVDPTSDGRWHHRRNLKLMISNSSSHAIRDVSIHVGTELEFKGGSLGSVLPGHKVDVVPPTLPGSYFVVPHFIILDMGVDESPTAPVTASRISLAFLDIYGHRWLRNENGRLQEIENPEGQ